jgi:hypothetical protein
METDMTSPADDLARVTALAALIGANDTESVIAATMPSLSDGERAALARYTSFTHAAVLIFPTSLDGLPETLAEHGIRSAP